MTTSPAAQKRTGAQEHMCEEDLQRPMRIRRQFFDGSHGLCNDGEPTPRNPARRSAWEIHPVYSIDVCRFRTLATCRFDREDVWVPLAEWLGAEGDN